MTKVCKNADPEKTISEIEILIDSLTRKIQHNPNDTKSLYELAGMLKSLARFEDAKKCYVRILHHFPEDINTLFDMAFACQHLDQENDALHWYNKLFEHDPNHAQAHINAGHINRIKGNIAQARYHFIQAQPHVDHSGLDILCNFSLPVIYESRKEIYSYRKRLADYVANKTARLTDPFKQVGITQFLLAYHGHDDTFLQQAIANFYYRSCPELNYHSPYLNHTNRHNKISIGFVTTFFFESHPVGKVYQGLIKNLNPNQFQVTLFHPSEKQYIQSKLHHDCQDIIQYLPCNLFQCQEIIASQKLDILFYPEIGMDPLIYFLAFSRLAKIQCAGWGHPVTSGIKNIDYYISTADMEPDNAISHYSERLIALNTFISYFYQPHLKDTHFSRSDFSLPDGHWYVCPQSIQKMHPDMDWIFAEILKNDPKGWLILYSGKYPALTQQLKDRMTLNMPDVIHRVLFLKSMPFEKFLRFLSLCDAVLDVPYFSSGTTTIEAISADIPIVTLPGPFFRNRLAYGCFKRINVLDTIATSVQQYIALANLLACDKGYKGRVEQKIRMNKGALFERQDVIQAYEQLFLKLWSNGGEPG